jgi:peptidoglycan/LPS O-acetylase OafA/YrhL
MQWPFGSVGRRDERHAMTLADTPRPKNYIAELEGWRGMAIAFLLLGHYGGALFFPFGRLGVEFFFVLSGRLMAHLLFVNKVSLRDFYVRRVSRVFPALWLFVFATLAVSDVFGKFGVTPRDAVHALTFTVIYTERPSVFEHIWSLCIEEHSYVALSLIALWSRRRAINVVGLLAVLAIAGILNGAFQTWYLGHDYFSVYWRSDVRASSILISAAIYLHLRSNNTQIDPVLCAVVIMSGISLELFKVVPDPIKYSFGTLLLAIGVAGAEKLPDVVKAFLTSRIVTTFGLWSFSIYLWQQPGALKDHHVFLFLLAAITAGVASFYLVEQPARRWINARISRSAPAPALEPSTAT